MTQENKKTINVQADMVVKKSPEFKKITHKAIAGMSEAEAIDKHTIGGFGDGTEKDEDEKTQSNL